MKEDCTLVFVRPVHPKCSFATEKIKKIISEPGVKKNIFKNGFKIKKVKLTCGGNVFEAYPMPLFAFLRLKRDPQNKDNSLFLRFDVNREGIAKINLG